MPERSPAYFESERLLRQLHECFLTGMQDSPEADCIRDQMETPWYAMTEEEQGEIERLSVHLYDEAEKEDH